MDPSAAAGLRQDFVNYRDGEILLCVTLPCIKETVRFPPEGPDGGGCYVRGQPVLRAALRGARLARRAETWPVTSAGPLAVGCRAELHASRRLF